jgi:hypothetical protein
MAACNHKQSGEITTFTRTDSLTDMYLSLQDSLLVSWNAMINDDNQKIKIMKNLHHELRVCGQFDPMILNGIQERLDQLQRIRYTSKTMLNTDVIEEYDFASQSLVTEIISLAESHKGYAYNKALQSMVDEIRAADMRVENYRSEYDALAIRYNKFIEANKDHMKEIAENEQIAQKPLFQTSLE